VADCPSAVVRVPCTLGFMETVPVVGGNTSASFRLGSPGLAAMRLLQIVVVPIILGAWAASSNTSSIWLLFTVALIAVAALFVRFRGALLISSAVLAPAGVQFESLFSRRIQTVQLSEIDRATWNRPWGAVVLSVSGGRRYFVTTASWKRTKNWLNELKDQPESAIRVATSWNGLFPS
jgi:hypothetical protein